MLDLPGYQMSRDYIDSDVSDALESMEDADKRLKEITALAGTQESTPLAVFELIRDEMHASIGKREVWFYSIVSTTLDSLAENLGTKAMQKVGDPVPIDNPWVQEKIRLVPVVTDVDTFIRDIYDAAMSESQPRLKAKQLRSFLFYSEGLGSDKLDADLALAREDLLTQFARQKGA